MEKGSSIVYAGWLERKGTSRLTPWTTRWVVLSLDSVKHYKEDKTTLKGELKLDVTARVVLADNDTYNNYRFAIVTALDSLEFGVTDLDERNMWLQKFIHATERKSELGAFVMRVSSDTEYRNAHKWEQVVVADSVDSSSGIAFTPGPSVKSPKATESAHAPQFASFVPFDAWLEAFEPEVRQAREQAAKDEELRKQGVKVPDTSSSMERLRDYMVESIVTNITDVSTTKFCNLLLEGMCQLIAASERQLARTYHACRAAEAEAIASGTVTPQSSTANLVTINQNTQKPEQQEIPLSVQEDLLCTLGSLRAVVLSYRFHDASRDAQMRFTRRLAVRQLERSLSRVLNSLEELQAAEQKRLAEAAEKAAAEATTVAGLVLDESTSTTAAASESTTSSDDPATAGQPVQQQQTAAQKAVEARRASLRQLRAIMRPLLSREFLQLEAAPLLQDFMNKNSSSLAHLEGLAAEVTNTFGAMVQAFIEKKINDLEEAVIEQIDKFVNVISEYSEQPEQAPTLPGTAETEAAKTDLSAVGATMADLSLPTSTREVMVRLAQEKAAVDRKIAKIKTEGSVAWDGTDKSLVEMVLLEQTDLLWSQLQDSVRMCISGGLYALLDMAGGGLSAAGAAAAEQHAQAAHAAAHTTPPPAPAPAPAPARTGYFF